MPATASTLTLNNGVEMTALGFGVCQIPPEETASAVEAALGVGYRLIDAAAGYLNEREVGEGVRRSGVERDQIFVVTKLWITDYGYDAALQRSGALTALSSRYSHRRRRSHHVGTGRHVRGRGYGEARQAHG
jgi:diketogulonate reductase-like aldo/keto reductase